MQCRITPIIINLSVDHSYIAPKTVNEYEVLVLRCYWPRSSTIPSGNTSQPASQPTNQPTNHRQIELQPTSQYLNLYIATFKKRA